MRDERRKSIVAFRHTKLSALEIVARYRDTHKPVYSAFDKNCFYDWTINDAYEQIKRAHDTPLNVLDGLLAKYDEWAHANHNTCHFAVALAAIDDLIDAIISG